MLRAIVLLPTSASHVFYHTATVVNTLCSCYSYCSTTALPIFRCACITQCGLLPCCCCLSLAGIGVRGARTLSYLAEACMTDARDSWTKGTLRRLEKESGPLVFMCASMAKPACPLGAQQASRTNVWRGRVESLVTLDKGVQRINCSAGQHAYQYNETSAGTLRTDSSTTVSYIVE